ncbi:hypothetical protein [Psittacicella gerlachiana]|uniref:Uncharacterized protein n=1 Tax=Psittacicella gerlachiana TaxID=2028574 RepID=A0A3A1YH83_9GAMM|nr:hypothetical protein [Psittacicella gerlachiana]RIY35584.1 hypothetical protein CKF59_03495 [Psittacicella gerlachiana]
MHESYFLLTMRWDSSQEKEVNALWSSLACDLYLANLEHTPYHWQNELDLAQAEIKLKTEPKLKLIVAYSQPLNYLLEHQLTLEQVTNYLEGWQDFYTQVLHLKQQYLEKVILISEQALQEGRELAVNLLQERLGLTKSLSNSLQSLSKVKAWQISCADRYLTAEFLKNTRALDELYQQLEQQALLRAQEFTSQESFTLETFLSLIKPEQKIQALEATLTKLQEQCQGLFLENQKLKEKEYVLTQLENRYNQLVKEKLKLEQSFLRLQERFASKLESRTFTSQEMEGAKAGSSPYEPKTHYAPLYYGAAQRVKEQLSYRLGATIVQAKGSLLKMLVLPFSLFTTYWAYRRYRKAQALRKLPPLEAYQDIAQAHEVMQHLSYRLGKVLVEDLRQPYKLKWLLLPWHLCAQVREFKQYQKNKKA